MRLERAVSGWRTGVADVRRVAKTMLLVAVAVLVVAAVAPPALAQDDEDDGATLTLPGSGREVPLYVVDGDIFILEDRDWCENLIALTEEQGTDGAFLSADAVRTELCAVFMERLAQNEVALLPLSLARQLVALPDELLSAEPLPSFVPERSVAAVSGTGESRSETFALRGGDYEAHVRSTLDCEFFAAFLTTAVEDTVVTDVEVSGSLPAIEPGDYYWDVLAPGCDWAIELHSSTP